MVIYQFVWPRINTLSDDPTKLGRPRGFKINIREVYVSAGAGLCCYNRNSDDHARSTKAIY